MSRLVIFLSFIAGGQMVLQELIPPRMVEPGYNMSVIEGDRFELGCHVSAAKRGEATQTIIWKLEDKVLKADTVYVRIDPNLNISTVRKPSTINHMMNSYSTYLVVTQADQSYAGRYYCVVEWTTDKDPVQNMYVVNVIIPATIVAKSTRVEKREGEDAELICVAQGTPRPSVHWTSKNRGTIGKANSSILHLKNLSREDSGEYTCLASNGAGSTARANIILSVQYSPNLTPLAPEFLSEPGGSRAAYLKCEVDSNPTSEVVWYRNDMMLNKVSTSNGTHYTLMVNNVRPSDLGIYECIARNNIGEARGSIELSGQPTRVMISNTTYTSIDKIQLTWHTESFAPVNNTTIFFRKSVVRGWGNKKFPGLVWSQLIFHHPSVSRTGRDSSQFSYLLRDLQPDTEYEVKLKSSNQFGDSPETVPILFRTKHYGYGSGDKSKYTSDMELGSDGSTSVWNMWGKRNCTTLSTSFSLYITCLLNLILILSYRNSSHWQW